MIGERIIAIYESVREEDWIIFQTIDSFYEIRLGAVLNVNEKIDLANYKVISNEKIGFIVSQIWTDGQIVYFVLEDKSLISVGFLIVDPDGNMHLSVLFNERDELGNDFIEFENDEDVNRIIVQDVD